MTGVGYGATGQGHGLGSLPAVIAWWGTFMDVRRRHDVSDAKARAAADQELASRVWIAAVTR